MSRMNGKKTHTHTVQSDGMTGKHRDGKKNLLERAQISEDKDKVVADSTLHADQGGKLFFQAEAGMDLETSQNSQLCELRIDYLIEDG